MCVVRGRCNYVPRQTRTRRIYHHLTVGHQHRRHRLNRQQSLVCSRRPRRSCASQLLPAAHPSTLSGMRRAPMSGTKHIRRLSQSHHRASFVSDQWKTQLLPRPHHAAKHPLHHLASLAPRSPNAKPSTKLNPPSQRLSSPNSTQPSAPAPYPAQQQQQAACNSSGAKPSTQPPAAPPGAAPPAPSAKNPQQ